MARPRTARSVRLSGEGVSWTAQNATKPVQNGAARRRRRPVGSVELDRATERIEAWMLDWLMTRLGLTPDDVSRDRPFAEYGVDSLTAVELSHELEQQFSVPLPPIVAWNYPTPAALARFLAEETLGVKREEPAEAHHATNGCQRRRPMAPAARMRPTTPSWPPSWPKSKISPTPKRRGCWRKSSNARKRQRLRTSSTIVSRILAKKCWASPIAQSCERASPTDVAFPGPRILNPTP